MVNVELAPIALFVAGVPKVLITSTLSIICCECFLNSFDETNKTLVGYTEIENVENVFNNLMEWDKAKFIRKYFKKPWLEKRIIF